jgi:phytoene desaturase
LFLTCKQNKLKKAIVIGAGFSGLSAAINLAHQGWEVQVLEKNAAPGGRASKFSAEGFTFDLGPSWYWLPDVFERFFEQFGKKSSDYYKLHLLDPSYRVFYGPGDSLDIPSGPEEVAAAFESIEAGAGPKLMKMLNDAKYKYEIGMNELVYKPALSISEYLTPEVMRGALKMKIFTSMDKYVRQNFRNPRLFPILWFPVVFLGSTPRRTPALYSLMNWADMGLGTWYPEGGMYSVVEGFYRLALEKGVKFHFNTPVTRIISSGTKVSSVMTSTGEFKADAYIASADYHHVEQELLIPADRRYSPSYWDKREMAPSALLFFLGVNKKIAGLQHHNLMFDEDFDTHAEAIFENPAWPEKPLLYVSATSVTDPGAAPEGMENIVVLIPVAPGLDDSEEVRKHYLDLSIGRLEKLCGENIRDHIVFSRSYAHREFSQDFNAYKGNAYGLGNTLKQTAIFKPRITSKLENMVYAGQLTTPGPGVPPTIISGQVAANLIHKRLG